MPTYTTTERLKMLENVMLHPQLNDADRRIYWYLVIKLLNEETGLAYCANSHIAKQLSLTGRTVKRSKASLKKLGLLSYASGKADHTATSYKLFKHTPTGDTQVTSLPSTKMFLDVRGTSTSPVLTNHVTSTGDTHVTRKTKTGDTDVTSSTGDIHVTSRATSNNTQDHLYQHLTALNGGYGVYIKDYSPEWAYWDAFLRKKTGKGAMRDRRGGWRFPSRWPYENQH